MRVFGKKTAGVVMWLCGAALLGALMLGATGGVRAAPSPSGLRIEQWRATPLARCAQIGPLPCVTPLPPPAGPQTITFQSATDSTTCGTSCTFSSLTIGSTCPNRLIVVSTSSLQIGNSGAQSISSATIGGVTATVVKTGNNTNGTNGAFSGIISAAVPTGTTASVVFTFGISVSRQTIGLWTLCNLQSTTAKNSASATPSSNTLTLSLNTNAGDVGVADYVNSDSGTNLTWTGATSRYANAPGGTTTGGADFAETATQSPRAITAASATCSTQCVGTSASWH